VLNARVALRKNAKVELLKSVPLFAGCSKKDLGEIALVTDELELGAGTTLIAEGSRAHEFFVLLDGSVEVTSGGKLLTELGPGSHFGEIALVSDVPRTATVRATSPVRVLLLTDRAFARLMRKVPSIAISVLESLAERVTQDATA